jgi:hypothetical protein
MSFERSLDFGLAGETAIAQWLKRRGYTILPVYEKILDTGKGPQLYTPNCELIAPDLLVYRGDKVLWIEAKRKAAFSWHRITQRWVTGIDLRHYEDYCRVDDTAPWPVWLLFLQEGKQAKDSPPDSPAGLFGNALDYLRLHENHRHENWGKTGMVYWSLADLRLMAELGEVAND